MARATNKPTKRTTQPKDTNAAKKIPFIEHVYELRTRLFIVAFSVALGSGLAYAFQNRVIAALLKPAGHQQFIYTTPGGGFDFQFTLCLYAGFLFAIPVIVFQLLRYLQPLIKQSALRFIVWGSVASAFLAVVGMIFGYFYGLPAAMHFLLTSFSSDRIQALISIQSYFSFVMLYLLGSAILFQVPLIMILVNRITPLPPGKLMRFQRWFIVIAFILGAIVSPSPDIRNQSMLSVPMIIMYQLGVIIVWFLNRKHRKATKLAALREQDAAKQAVRQAQFQHAQDQWVSGVSDTAGSTVRQSPTQRTWQEPQTTDKPTPIPISVERSPQFSQPAPRRSYQIQIQAE